MFPPCVSIEFSAFVDAEDEVYLFAGSEGLVEYSFVMLLCCPQAFLYAQVKVGLQNCKYDQSHVIKPR